MSTHIDAEATLDTDDAAAVLDGLAADLAGGDPVRVSLSEQAATLDAPSGPVDAELEVETADGAVELEVELAWPGGVRGATGTGADDESEEAGDAAVAAAVADAEEAADDADAPASLGRFEVYRDRAEEWRWRLVHRNGNVIATSGEGYTRRHNAEKGLRSVMRNTPGAAVEGTED